MGLRELQDATIDFRNGYHMVKPPDMYSWARMFPDINCDFEDKDCLQRTVWYFFLEGKVNLFESDEESELNATPIH